MRGLGITVYGCERDEAAAFEEHAPRFGIVPAVTGEAVTWANARLALGNRFVSVSHRFEVPADALRALKGAGVRCVCTRSVGVNHIDVRAAERMGIAVRSVAYSPGSVADYTVMLMLMAIRGAKAIVSRAQANDFTLGSARGREMRDMTVGVLGTGRIGRAVIERLHGFGCRVLAHGRAGVAGAEHVPFEGLLRASDILTVHLPLRADTRHLLGRAQLSLMRPGAYLVNTARGAIVDTAALVEALACGRLGGAALDVLEGEEGIFYLDHTHAPVDNQHLAALQGMPNVILTPHTAYHTGRALRDTVEMTLQGCRDFDLQQKEGHGPCAN